MAFKANIVILLTFLFMLLMTGCYKSCPESKKKFLSDFDKLITETAKTKRLKTDKAWDLSDKRFRKFIYECQPKFHREMDNEESLLFWENALGYIYVRYGTDLLKKYGQTDQLIIRVKDSLFQRNIIIEPAVKRLCREWPVLFGASDEDISDQIKDAFDLKNKKYLITPDSSKLQ